jgi:hypothetical protein
LPEFPVPVVERIHTIAPDDERGRVWVGGSQRYAIVDMVHPARSLAFQMPVTSCAGCDPRLWVMHLSPHRDRVYMLNRQQSMAAVVLSTLESAPESPGRILYRRFFSDFVENPRTGDFLVLGWNNAETPVYLVDPGLRWISEIRLPRVGHQAIDLELLP